MRYIRLEFYVKCPKCGMIDYGLEEDSPARRYKKLCPKCLIQTMPEVRVKGEVSDREGGKEDVP